MPVVNIFVSVFFVLVGLQVNLQELNPFSPTHLGKALAGQGLLGVAIFGKLATGFGITDKRINKLVIGTGMMPRGEVWIIFASIGLSQGIIRSDLYGMLILIAFITTLITPVLMKYAFRRSVANNHVNPSPGKPLDHPGV